MTDAITFTDEYRPFVQTFTASRNGKILASNVRPAFKDEIERLRAQNAQLLAAAKTALIFIESVAAEKIDKEYEYLVVRPLKAAIEAAESEGQ